MAEQAELEVHTIAGREVKIRRKLARHGEWLAWSYVPGPNLLPHEGIGFEARAGTPEEATRALIEKLELHLGGTSRGGP
jgi:hypothetical protein